MAVPHANDVQRPLSLLGCEKWSELEVLKDVDLQELRRQQGSPGDVDVLLVTLLSILIICRSTVSVYNYVIHRLCQQDNYLYTGKSIRKKIHV